MLDKLAVPGRDVNSANLKAIFLLSYALATPLIVLLRQYFGLMWAGDIAKVYSVAGILVFSGDFMCAVVMRRKQVLLLLFIFSYALALSLFAAATSGVNINSLVPHVVAFGTLVLFAGAFSPLVITELVRLAKKVTIPNLAIHVVIGGFYIIDPLGRGGYAGFDSSGLIPTFLSTLISGQYGLAAIHLLIMTVQGKRAILYVAALLFVVYVFARSLRSGQFRLRTLLLMAAVLASFGAAIFVVAAQGPSGGVGGRAFGAIVLISQGDFSQEGSLEEKVSEVLSVYGEVMQEPWRWVTGAGLGWSYVLDSPFVNYEELENRHYIHFSPAFFHVSLGLIGVAFYLALWFLSVRTLFMNDIAATYLGCFLFFQLSLSPTRLNILTEPAVQYAVGGVLFFAFSKKRSTMPLLAAHFSNFARRNRLVFVVAPSVAILAAISWLHIQRPSYRVTLSIVPVWVDDFALSNKANSSVGNIGRSAAEQTRFLLYLQSLQNQIVLSEVARVPEVQSWIDLERKNDGSRADSTHSSDAAWLQDYLKKNLRIIRKRQNALVRIVLTTRDPVIGRIILDSLHAAADSRQRAHFISYVDRRIEFLSTRLGSPLPPYQKQAIERIIVEQEALRVRARAPIGYVAGPLDRAVVGSTPVLPNAPINILLMLLAAVSVALLATMLRSDARAGYSPNP